MPARFQPWILVALGGFVIGCAPEAMAQDQGEPLTIESARAGIGGICKAGFWSPIWLNLKAGPAGAAGALEIVTPDGDNVPVVYGVSEADALAIGPHQSASLLRYVKLGRENAPIAVRLRNGERVVWSQELAGLPPRLAATQELIVGIGDDLNLNEAIASSRRSPELSLVVAQTQSAAELPDQWLGYEGVDWVVLAVGDGESLQALSTQQRDALLLWLRLGGRLIVSVGRGGEQLAAADSPWNVLLPGKLVEVSPLRDRAGLEAFTNVELPWEDDEFRRTRPLVTRLTEIDGPVLVDEVGSGTDRPLAARAAYGLGEVVFIGLDLAHPGFARWPGRPKLLSNILGSGYAGGDDARAEHRRGLAHLGYDDLTGQLRAALDQFPGVTLVSFTTVSVITAVYLLLIGPADFLILSRLNIPRQVTWLTFGLLAVACVGVAWMLGRATHGEAACVNQLEIVDLDAKLGVVRGTGWAHWYSPQTARVTLAGQSAVPWATPDGGALAWQGLPGSAIGGLASRQRPLVAGEPYRIGQPGRTARIEGLPVQCASSKSLALRWWGTWPPAAVAPLARNSFGALDGEVTNPLPVALTDCLVAFEDKLYRLGKLAPGQSVDLGGRTPLNLEARITQRTIEGSREVSTLWKRDSTDLARIVQMLMFHEAAGGRNYTGLTHRYQPYLDLSGHLKLNRALLVGRADEPATRLEPAGESAGIAGRTDGQAWFRIAIPVSEPSSPANAP
jgi:hypothetical protein